LGPTEKVLPEDETKCNLRNVVFLTKNRTMVNIQEHVTSIFGAQLATCFHPDFLLRSFLDPEAGGIIFLRNVV
jgi:hypothetical protein